MSKNGVITFEDQRVLDSYVEEHGIPRELPNGGVGWFRPLGNNDYKKKMRILEERYRKTHSMSSRDRAGNFRDPLPLDVSEELGREASIGTILLRIEGVPLRRADDDSIVYMESTAENMLSLFESPVYYDAILGHAADLQMTEDEKAEVLSGNLLSASSTT